MIFIFSSFHRETSMKFKIDQGCSRAASANSRLHCWHAIIGGPDARYVQVKFTLIERGFRRKTPMCSHEKRTYHRCWYSASCRQNWSGGEACDCIGKFVNCIPQRVFPVHLLGEPNREVRREDSWSSKSHEKSFLKDCYWLCQKSWLWFFFIK